MASNNASPLQPSWNEADTLISQARLLGRHLYLVRGVSYTARDQQPDRQVVTASNMVMAYSTPGISHPDLRRELAHRLAGLPISSTAQLLQPLSDHQLDTMQRGPTFGDRLMTIYVLAMTHHRDQLFFLLHRESTEGSWGLPGIKEQTGASENSGYALARHMRRRIGISFTHLHPLAHDDDLHFCLYLSRTADDILIRPSIPAGRPRGHDVRWVHPRELPTLQVHPAVFRLLNNSDDLSSPAANPTAPHHWLLGDVM